MSHAHVSVVLLAASLLASSENNLAPRALLHGDAVHYVTSDASVLARRPSALTTEANPLPTEG